MPVLMTRAAQLALALPGLKRERRRAARPRRRRPPLRLRRLPPCPLCRGPVAAGEGYATCVVCGDRRAA